MSRVYHASTWTLASGLSAFLVRQRDLAVTSWSIRAALMDHIFVRIISRDRRAEHMGISASVTMLSLMTFECLVTPKALHFFCFLPPTIVCGVADARLLISHVLAVPVPLVQVCGQAVIWIGAHSFSEHISFKLNRGPRNLRQSASSAFRAVWT